MENLYSLIDEIKKISGNLLEGQVEPASEKECVLLFAIAKSEKTLNAIILLCREGFGEDSAILGRSIFELYWSVEYILSSDDNYFAERFFAYDWIVRKEMYEIAKENSLLHNSDGNEIKEIEAKAKEVQEKYRFKKYRGWSDKSMREMSELIGHGNIYNTAYKIQCSLCHPNPRATNDYFKEGENGEFVLNAGPSINLVEESLFSGLITYFGIVKKFNIFFAKGFDEDINKLEDKIKLLVS